MLRLLRIDIYIYIHIHIHAEVCVYIYIYIYMYTIESPWDLKHEIPECESGRKACVMVTYDTHNVIMMIMIIHRWNRNPRPQLHKCSK